jgi:hypothetical protein
MLYYLALAALPLFLLIVLVIVRMKGAKKMDRPPGKPVPQEECSFLDATDPYVAGLTESVRNSPEFRPAIANFAPRQRRPSSSFGYTEFGRPYRRSCP